MGNSLSNVDIIPPNVRIILTHGIAGCGKSTWAQTLVDANPERFVRVGRDELRLDIYGDNYFSKPSRPQEKAIDLAQRTVIQEYLARGKTVIIDDTNVKPWVIWRMVTAATSVGVKIEDIYQRYFDVPFSRVLEQNEKRHREGGRLAPVSLIAMMAEMAYVDDSTLKRYTITEDGIISEGRIYTTDKEGVAL